MRFTLLASTIFTFNRLNVLLSNNGAQLLPLLPNIGKSSNNLVSSIEKKGV